MQFPNVQSNKSSYAKAQDTSSSDDDNCVVKETLKKKKRKTIKKNKEQNYPKEIEENLALRKYYDKRYFLFSKYEEGIQMDSGTFSSYTF